MARCEAMEMRSLLPFRANAEEGIIFVDEIDSSGVIRRGRHREPNGPDRDLERGMCRESERTFECERPGFRYAGRIFSFNGDRIVIVVGRRSPRQGLEREKDREQVDEEVWVGVKTGT